MKATLIARFASRKFLSTQSFYQTDLCPSFSAFRSFWRSEGRPLSVAASMPREGPFQADGVDKKEGKEDGKAFDYDFFVIGIGSGGVRAARMAASYGAKV